MFHTSYPYIRYLMQIRLISKQYMKKSRQNKKQKQRIDHLKVLYEISFVKATGNSSKFTPSSFSYLQFYFALQPFNNLYCPPSMFHQNYEEDHHYEDLNLEDKIALNTYNTLRNQPSALSPLYQSQQLKARESTLDISFQNQIYSNNAQLIQLNMIQYFNSSLKQKITTEVVFRDGLLFSFQGQQESTDTHFLSNILQNKHLTKAQRKVFENCYKQFQEFRAFLEELSRLFGKSIGKELGYLIGIILENKLQPYKSLKSTTFPMFLPQFPRFYGEDQSEIQLNDSNNLECSLDYCEIKKFATIGVEDFCTKIYFSNNIQFLNLKKITVDLSENVNLIQKFTSFMESLSETVFLTLAGYSLQEQQLDMFKEEINLNLIESPHGILNNSLSKKVKYDFL